MLLRTQHSIGLINARHQPTIDANHGNQHALQIAPKEANEAVYLTAEFTPHPAVRERFGFPFTITKDNNTLVGQCRNARKRVQKANAQVGDEQRYVEKKRRRTQVFIVLANGTQSDQVYCNRPGA